MRHHAVPISRFVRVLPLFIAAALSILLARGPLPAAESLDVRSDGSDGAFEPTLSSEGVVDGVLTVDLSRAPTVATWKTPGDDTGVYGRGVYDPVRWAVVFKYSRVTIPEGLTVRFQNHPKRAPVVWLVDGDVTIAGTVDLDGEDSVRAPRLTEPGPGGFRGGMGYVSADIREGPGFGPGGGGGGPGWASGGSHRTRGRSSAHNPYPQITYGNPSLLPLVGGSGGTGYSSRYSGGGGGGALLLASAGRLTLDGAVTARGGTRPTGWSGGHAGGSGGAIRLVARILDGSGSLAVSGGQDETKGGSGRIRLEYREYAAGADVQSDVEPSVLDDVPLAPRLWLQGDDGDPDAPEVRIVSVGGVDAPADPRASMGAGGHDVVLPKVSEVEVIVETRGIAEAEAAAATVRVRAGPRTGEGPRLVAAERHAAHPDDDPGAKILYWRATVTVGLGATVFQVQLVRP